MNSEEQWEREHNGAYERLGVPAFASDALPALRKEFEAAVQTTARNLRAGAPEVRDEGVTGVSRIAYPHVIPTGAYRFPGRRPEPAQLSEAQL